VQLGPLNADVAITLAGGTVLHAVVTSEAVAALGLAPGVPALALIKPSQVVLAA
jgi:molybdate transport system regulatory protein